MRIIIVVILIIGLYSCINHNPRETSSAEFIQKSALKLRITEAEGFELIYEDTYTALVSKSIDGNSEFNDSLFLVHDGYSEINGRKTLRSSINSISCQSSTHLAYLSYLDVLSFVSGHCGMEFIVNPEIRKALEENNTTEICAGESVQFEKIITTKPALFLVYPFAEEEVKDLHSKGIPTFMIGEYLEKTPLARLEWIKLFGVLMGKEQQASAYFEKVSKSYKSLTQPKKDTNMRFIFNLPFGDTWYTPSANSLVVKLFEDAGMSYFYENEIGTENTPHTKEEIWANGGEANYWVIIANRPEGFSLADLKSESEVYANFKSVKNNQVIFCNTTSSDYFLSGVIEPDVMLKDILFALHKTDKHQPKYFHLLK